MNIYKVVFKDHAVRIYSSDFPCADGDTIVADTSHGPLLATVREELEQLPEDMDANRMRSLLCRVPIENSVGNKPTDRRLARMEELSAEMDLLMKEKYKTIMRRIFADYCDNFSVLMDEYDRLDAEDECVPSETAEQSAVNKAEYDTVGEEAPLLLSNEDEAPRSE